MSYELILSEVRGRVGVITMNRPDKLNAMNPQMNHEIISQISEWNGDDSIGPREEGVQRHIRRARPDRYVRHDRRRE